MYKLNPPIKQFDMSLVTDITNIDPSIITLIPAKSIIRVTDGASIPFDPANTDYANFKKVINEETSELQDADGNTMTAAEAKAFVATLP